MSGETHQIWYSPYRLRARADLNAKSSSREREGALLRVERDGASGFADLFPWPELGDRPLGEQLESLRGDEATRSQLVRRSLALADLDREARLEDRSAFQGLSVPLSHALISGGAAEWNHGAFAEIERRRAEGFTTFKFKIGRHPQAEAQALNELAPVLSTSDRLRFDANEAMTAVSVRAFVAALDARVKKAIEFIEDPVPLRNLTQAQELSALGVETGISFALDRGAWPPHTPAEASGVDVKSTSDGREISDATEGQETVSFASNAFRWLIIKPAVQNPFRLASQAKLKSLRICVTSYLDHPVGQMGAALEAARLNAQGFHLGTCGLLSHSAYESNEFSEALQTQGPKLITSDEPGIGFGNLLESQEWKPL